MSVNIFELSWSWWEEEEHYLYVHSDPYKTQEEFDNDVKFLCIKYANDYLKHENKSWAGFNGLIDFISNKMPELGYEPVNILRVNVTGTRIIKDKNSQCYNEISKLIGNEIADKFIKHNEKLSNKISEKRIINEFKN